MDIYIYIYIYIYREELAVRILCKALLGGVTCLTLLVGHVFSSSVANHVADYDDP